MKKVVLFANSTWCLYNFRYNLMKSLLEEGCIVYALAPLDPTYDNATFLRGFRELGVEFIEVPLQPRGLNPLRELLSIRTIFNVLSELQPDVVLSYTVKCNLYAGFCRQVLGFEQIANVPGLGEVFERRTLLSHLVSWLYRLSFRGMSKAFFQNNEDLKYCLERRLVPPGRCVVIPGSGVDLRRFAPSFPPRVPGKRRFLMFGRLLPQKGYAEYLQAAEKLQDQFGDSVECWVMGIEDRNRPDSTELYASVRDAEIRGIIRLIPTQVDVTPILNQVDCVVLPSRYNEGIPRSLLEAMATGKVIITTDWRGCRETVDHGQNGYLVPVKSFPDLVQAMLKVVEAADSEVERMGRASRRIVEKRFNEQLVLGEYLRSTLGYVPADSGDDLAADAVHPLAHLQEFGLPAEELA